MTEKQSLLPKPARYQKHPPPPVRRPTRSLHISISLLILAFFVLYAQKSFLKNGKRVYAFGGQQLPDWYGICSKEGKKVYTVPEEGSGVGAVECVVVGGKEVVDTGSLAKIRRRWGEKGVFGGVDNSPDHIREAGGLEILYLPPGHSLTPGLVDSHTHPLEYGHSQQLPLLGSKSVQQVIEKVEHFVKTNYTTPSKGAWIEGLGWDQNIWEVKEFPTAVDLEASDLLKGLPIALKRIDVHAEWVSPAILKLLGDLPKEVDGGQIVRDANGEPTGIFIDNAIDLIDAIRPPWTFEQMESYLNILARDGLSKGLTGVHDAGAIPRDIAFFMKIEEMGKLPMRFYTMLACPNREEYCGDQIPMIDNAGDGKLNLKSVKLFADGALGSRGAALIDDYSDLPGWKGIMRSKEEIWKPLIKSFHDAGWQVNVHAIGDRANQIILNAMESALSPNLTTAKARRFRLEHAQILTLPDLHRAANLGIIASYQPTHATSDMSYAEARLGKERIKGAYAWKTYLNAGGRITLGSDFPVESLDPLRGFYAGVTRCWEGGGSPHGDGGWHPEEKLSREEALRGMTVDPAYASFSSITGSFALGKRFDAVIWDDDLMTVDESEMLDVKVRATLIDGRLVYGKI